MRITRSWFLLAAAVLSFGSFSLLALLNFPFSQYGVTPLEWLLSSGEQWGSLSDFGTVPETVLIFALGMTGAGISMTLLFMRIAPDRKTRYLYLMAHLFFILIGYTPYRYVYELHVLSVFLYLCLFLWASARQDWLNTPREVFANPWRWFKVTWWWVVMMLAAVSIILLQRLQLPGITVMELVYAFFLFCWTVRQILLVRGKAHS